MRLTATRSSVTSAGDAGAAELWTPAELDGVQLWLDASDASTITLNGSTVSQWDDKSGNNRHATQATASNQPTYTTAGLNGKNVLTFSNAGSTYLSIPSDVDDYFPYQSAFIVYSDTSTALYVTPLGGRFHSSATRAAYHGHQYNTQIFSGSFTAPETLNGDNFKNGTDIGDGLSTPRPGSTPAIFSYIADAEEDPFDVDRRLGIIGADFASTAIRGITGLIAEIVILENAASVADRKKTEGYLAHRWGLSADLPSDHPYKSSAPTV